MTELNLPASPEARRTLLAERLGRRMAARHRALSYPQARLWFLDQLDPASAVYIVPLVYRVSGPLNVAALEHALTEVVRRHQTLRTVFRPVDGVPRQFVRPAGPVRIPVEDLSGSQDPAAEAERRSQEEARRPFDLESDPMIRPLLLRLGEREHWFCLTLHHIACDGWSLALLGDELSVFYRAHVADEDACLPALPLQYADFAEEQVARMAGAPLAEMLAYWRERLAGAPALASLPADRPRPPTQTHAGDHLDFLIDPDVAERVGELARECGATRFAVLLAAFAALVHAHAGGDEVIVGSPVSGRPQERLQRLIGFFANTVVQRVDVSGRPTFRELVVRARDESRAAVANQELPFEKLVEELHPSRDPAYNPLFQMMLSYQEDASAGLALPGCEVTMVPGDTATAKFDLTLSLTRTGEKLTARLEYSTDLFSRETAAAFGEQFRTVLAGATGDPDRSIGRLPVLSEAETRRVLVDWNPGPEPLPGLLVHELIERQALQTPEAPALLPASAREGGTVSYRELIEKADVLATRLRALGVRPDAVVGVYLDRSPDLVVTLLAILRAGGAYLPLDPAFPAARLEFMVRDAGAAVIATRGGLARRVAPLGVPLLEVDAPGLAGAPDPAGPGSPGRPGRPGRPPEPAGRQAQESLAYVIYTSGSTGNPKGVMISHRNVLNFFAGMDAVLAGDAPDTWLAVTSMSFDISVLELLWTLARGYRVVVRGDEPTAAAAADGTTVPSSVQAKEMDFSLFYFGGDRGGDPGDAYRLLLEGARFADRNGFSAVWTPERHFHEFGGLYPNPSVTAAAIATITERVAIRAGSVVLPLHDPLRVAEEWSVVDNLSGGGRVGLSVASGWQPTDFVLAPDAYADRKKIMMTKLAELRGLWRGEAARRRTGAGTETDVRIFPPPVSRELPVWVTSARSPETFTMAGEAGAGLLTHLLGHSIEQLAEKIALYRQAWREKGHAGNGHVTLMLHTFVGTDTEAVREIVRAPLREYIKSSLDLLSGLGQTLDRGVDLRSLPERELDELVARAFDRFFETSGLLGTPEHCADLVDRLKAAGVDEIACLMDFGVPHEQVIGSFEQLAVARELSEERRRAALTDEPVSVSMRRHRATHFQCTPSLAGLLVEETAGHEGEASSLAGLRRMLVGGEALPAPLAERLGNLLPDGVHNMYGPTEATVWATTAPVTASGRVTIGRPMTNVRAYVVDTYLRPTPDNAPGELLLGGPGLARGYLGRPGLTADRFIPDPFSGLPGARLYRTGDLARRLPSGDLEFLGRLDHQVKVHGHRIELGEIENVLRGHPWLRAVVTAVHGADAHRRIVAYCVPVTSGPDRAEPDRAEPTAEPDRAEPTAEPTAESVRAFAARTLPDYMVPADVIFLEDLPMTPNGKVDRKRLPDPQRPRRAEYRPPDNDTERQVAEGFAEVLKIDRVGVEDNFFEVGGNSLLAVQARNRLLPVLGDRLTLVDLFRYPTVRALVTALAGDGASGDLARVRAAAGRRADAFARRASARQARRTEEV